MPNASGRRDLGSFMDSDRSAARELRAAIAARKVRTETSPRRRAVEVRAAEVANDMASLSAMTSHRASTPVANNEWDEEQAFEEWCDFGGEA